MPLLQLRQRRQPRQRQKEKHPTSLLQMGMDREQRHFDPEAVEHGPELQKIQARRESARSGALQQLKPTGITNTSSMVQRQANNTGQSRSTSAAPSGSGSSSSSSNSSSNDTSSVGSGKDHRLKKEFPSLDHGGSVYVKAQKLWGQVQPVLFSARGFRDHLSSGSGGPLFDIGLVVLSLSGIALFFFCLLVHNYDKLPTRQSGEMQTPVKTGAARASWTGPNPSPRESLECSPDLVLAKSRSWDRRSATKELGSRSPLAVGRPSLPTPAETARLRSGASVINATKSAFAFDNALSSPPLMVAPPDGGQRPAAQQSAPSVLCAGLVVPDGCECTLLVPRMKPTYANREATVNDLANIPVFNAVFCRPTFPTGAPKFPAGAPISRESTDSLDLHGDRCLSLYATSDDGTLLAYCRSGLNNTLGILNADDVAYGVVRMRTGRLAGGFEVITQAGSSLHLSENKFGDVIISDRHGRTLALTEAHDPEPEYRLLRAGPDCDAGLATLCVLMVDLLKGTAEAGGGFPGQGRQQV